MAPPTAPRQQSLSSPLFRHSLLPMTSKFRPFYDPSVLKDSDSNFSLLNIGQFFFNFFHRTSLIGTVLFGSRFSRRAMPFSHHSHSGEFCGHGENTVEEVVQTAISKKFQVYALTEHMPRGEQDLYPEEVFQPLLPEWSQTDEIYRSNHPLLQPHSLSNSMITITRLYGYKRHTLRKSSSSLAWK